MGPLDSSLINSITNMNSGARHKMRMPVTVMSKALFTKGTFNEGLIALFYLIQSYAEWGLGLGNLDDRKVLAVE